MAAPKKKHMPAEEQLELVKRAQAGDLSARHQLVQATMGFVARMAFTHARGRKGVAEDLLNEGAIGVMEAIDRFDVSRPNNFLTYASWYVRKNISQHSTAASSPLSGARSVRGNARPTMKAFDKARATGLGISEAIEAAAKETGHSVDAARDIIDRHQRTFGSVSFDAPIGGYEDSVSLGETIADHGVSQEDVLGEHESAADIRERLASMKLSVREEILVEFRFIAGETLQEVGARMGGLSRERVRQLEAQLLPRLRQHLSERARSQVARPQMAPETNGKSRVPHAAPRLVTVGVSPERASEVAVSSDVDTKHATPRINEKVALFMRAHAAFRRSA